MATLEEVEWAINNVTLPGAGTPNKIAPTQALKDNGFDEDQVPTCQEENFWRNKVYEWIAELDGRTITGFQGAYPVGSIYLNATDGTNPATLLGFGTWVRRGEGRVLIGEGTGTDDNAVQQTFGTGNTAGEYEHTLTTPEIPSHRHQVGGNDGESNSQAKAPFVRADGDEGDNYYTDYTGGGQAHNNVQPGFGVYIWERTA